jgi:hypothetical protein
MNQGASTMNQNLYRNSMKKSIFKPLIINGLLAFGSIAVAFLVLEFLTRYYLASFNPQIRQRIVDIQKSVALSETEKPRFLSHPYLSYYPSDIDLTEAGCAIDGATFTFTPPPNTFRIACLGGSTTMRSYPKYLAESLTSSLPNVNIEVMDWGCSGWTIVESMLNYTIRARLFHPDLVIMHAGINDVAPRSRRNFVFDYSHYRKSASNFRIPVIYRLINPSYLLTWLSIRADFHPADLDTLTVQPVAPDGYWEGGIIPPQTQIAYREAVGTLGSLCKGDGTTYLLAGMIYDVTQMLDSQNAKIVDQHNQVYKEYAAANHLMYVDLQNFFRFHKDYFVDQVHMNPWGDRIKANILANAIAKIKNVTPHVWVTDTMDSADDLVGSFDEDISTDRELVIHWDSVPNGTTEIHVYININGEEDMFLGNVSDMNQKSLSWTPDCERIQQEFRFGPQFGNRYQFSVWFINPEIHMPWVTHDFVTFRKTSN